jgi:hypothetical protein
MAILRDDETEPILNWYARLMLMSIGRFVSDAVDRAVDAAYN